MASLGDVLASSVAQAVSHVTKGIVAPSRDAWRSDAVDLEALIRVELEKAATVPDPYVDPETHRRASERVKDETRDASGRWTRGGAGNAGGAVASVTPPQGSAPQGQAPQATQATASRVAQVPPQAPWRPAPSFRSNERRLYPDDFISQRLGRGILPRSPGRSPTGGHWVTVHGQQTFIDDHGLYHHGGPYGPPQPRIPAAGQVGDQPLQTDPTGPVGNDRSVHRVGPPNDPYPVAYIKQISPSQHVITVGYDPDPVTRLPRDAVRQFRHSGDAQSADEEARSAVKDLHGELLGAYQNAHRATIAFDDAAGGPHPSAGSGPVSYGAVFPNRITPATVRAFTPGGFDPLAYLPGGSEAVPGSHTQVPAGPNAPGLDGGPAAVASIPSSRMIADLTSAATGIRTVAYRNAGGGAPPDFAIEVFGPDGTRLAEHHHQIPAQSGGAGFRNDDQVRDEVRRVAQWADQTAAIAHQVARLAAPAIRVRVPPSAPTSATQAPSASPVQASPPAASGSAVTPAAPDYRGGHWVMIGGHPVFIEDATGRPASVQPTARTPDTVTAPPVNPVQRPSEDFRNGGLPSGVSYQQADLQYAILAGVDLGGIDLSGANLIDADLRGANLVGANLTGANLADAQLQGALLQNANLNVATLTRADLTDADLSRVTLASANLTNADLSGADLTRADLSGANLTDAFLTDANLTRADLIRTILTDADLRRADLTRADLSRAELPSAILGDARLFGATLTNADLTNANLFNANLTDAELTGANLTDAELIGANLTDANLSNANLSNATLTDATLDRADLTGADLTGVTHAGATASGQPWVPASASGTPIAPVWAYVNGVPTLVDPATGLPSTSASGVTMPLRQADDLTIPSPNVPVDLSYADLRARGLPVGTTAHVSYRNANLRGANLSGCDLGGIDLRGADLTRAILIGANLTGAQLNGTDLTGSDLTGALCQELNLHSALASHAVLDGCDLTQAILRRGILNDASLIKAHLAGADLSHVDLSRADLTDATLDRANLNDATLTGADLTGADLTGCTWTGAQFSTRTLFSSSAIGNDVRALAAQPAGQPAAQPPAPTSSVAAPTTGGAG